MSDDDIPDTSMADKPGSPDAASVQPKFHRGGLVLSPGSGDSVPIFLHPGEQWYTAEQVKRMVVDVESSLATQESRDDTPGPRGNHTA